MWIEPCNIAFKRHRKKLLRNPQFSAISEDKSVRCTRGRVIDVLRTDARSGSHTGLLEQLAARRLLRRLSSLDTAAGQPPVRPVMAARDGEDAAVAGVCDERQGRLTTLGLHAAFSLHI